MNFVVLQFSCNDLRLTITDRLAQNSCFLYPSFLLGRPCTVVTGGLIRVKCSWCFFFFFSTPNLRAPSANHRETSPHDRCLCLFYKLTTKIRGALPPTKLGAKNRQNFGRFYTTFDFDREYLRNGSRYPKTESECFQNDSSCVLRKRPGKLWSTIYRDLTVSLDPLKCTYLTDYISAHRGCCAPKILHALEIDQALIAHTRSGTGGPPQKKL